MSMKFTEEEIVQLLEKYKYRSNQDNLERLPIKEETGILDKIRQGRYKELVKIHGLIDNAVYFGKATRSRKKLDEYYTAAWISGCTRAAIDGNMNPDDAYDLSDVLLGELENAETIDEIDKIFCITPYIFARAVANSRRSRGSYAVEQCRIYIARHIFKKISVDEVAGYVGLNPKYLSRIFAAEEHIPMYQYIQREKVETSCHLLRYSDRSISQIAQYMGFSSQSNFGVVFRKWKGMTPLEYRNLYYRDNYSFHE